VEENTTPLPQPLEIARHDDPVGELSDHEKENSMSLAAKDFAASGGSNHASSHGPREHVEKQPNPIDLLSPKASPASKKVITELSPSPVQGSAHSLNRISNLRRDVPGR
jgi:hypothetical protein